MVAMPPALAHTRKMMRNMASRPFSTPNRNIMGRVMSRMHTATHTDSRMTGMEGPVTSLSQTKERMVWRTKVAAAAMATLIQPKTYLLSTTSRAE